MCRPCCTSALTSSGTLQLAILFSAIYGVVGAPVAFQTFDPRQQPSQFLLSGAVGTGAVVLLAVLRIYLGWAVRLGSSPAQRVPCLCRRCRAKAERWVLFTCIT